MHAYVDAYNTVGYHAAWGSGVGKARYGDLQRKASSLKIEFSWPIAQARFPLPMYDPTT